MRGKYVVNPEVVLSPKLEKKYQQLRAVSSPTLSENLHDSMTGHHNNNKNNNVATTATNTDERSNNRPINSNRQQSTTTMANGGGVHKLAEVTNEHGDQTTHGSVLQKLRNTFSHLKGSKSTAPSTAHSHQPTSQNCHSTNDGSNGHKDAVEPIPPATSTNGTINTSSTDYPTTYRFGPLVWRSSKERRKTKHHRRDKCNSGDSGIQVELDNEESLHGPESLEASTATTTGTTTLNASVRRANSAKVQSSSAAAAAAASASVQTKLMRNSSDHAGNGQLQTRSLSQSSGLDRIAKEHDHHHSDTDSEDYTIHRPPQPPPADHPLFAEALYTFQPASDQELALERGSLVEVIKREPGPWWWGRLKYDVVGKTTTTTAVDDHNTPEGWFPKDFVRLIVPLQQANRAIHAALHSPDNQHARQPPYVEARNCDISFPLKPQSPVVSSKRAASESPSSVSPRTSFGAQSIEAIRASVVRELLDTEENYVKMLKAICTGFIDEMRRRPDIFGEESIQLIFSNIEQIWQFQQTFLDALRQGVMMDRVAETFLEYQSGFMVYSVYCNTYSRALTELDTYNGNPSAVTILENCRISQNLPELPLSAHLLAPIQRICRYPLHLIELVKHTTAEEPVSSTKLQQSLLDPNEQLVDDLGDDAEVDDDNVDGPLAEKAEHDSKQSLELALAAMKNVTEMVNEGKRHSEYLSRIQARFDNFQGPSISVHSTRLFLQTDAIRMTPNLWNNAYTLFLFDCQLIYCKKDLLKRTTYAYKGRIFLDNCRILNLPDGKIFGLTLKNALRIYCDERNKWFDFCFRSSSSKVRFLNTLSAERKFSGQSLFVTELAGVDDDDMSDREQSAGIPGESLEMSTENGGAILLVERAVDVENINPLDSLAPKDGVATVESQSSKFKKSDTLPKKSRKLQKEPTVTSYEYNSHSLGRKRLGNWFRKAKSTSTTPSQSPTHHPLTTVSASSSVDESYNSQSGYSNPSLNHQPSVNNPLGLPPVATQSIRPRDSPSDTITSP